MQMSGFAVAVVPGTRVAESLVVQRAVLWYCRNVIRSPKSRRERNPKPSTPTALAHPTEAQALPPLSGPWFSGPLLRPRVETAERTERTEDPLLSGSFLNQGWSPNWGAFC